MQKKIELGQYYTQNNPFKNSVFKEWLIEAFQNSKNKTILEPFVGNEDIINMLKEDFNFKYQGYDVDPKSKNTIKKDTLQNYPKGYNISITNPPYLARNSATRKKIKWIYNRFDDLYKVSLDKMLKNNDYVAAIVPATLLTSGLFRKRLSDYILLNMRMFVETDVPVCLALFKPIDTIDFNIWELSQNKIEFTGKFCKIEKMLNKVLEKNKDIKIKFNDFYGKYGVLATDKSYKSIKFVKGDLIPDSKVKVSSRNMVRFNLDKNISIFKLNKHLNNFFNSNGEIFLSPFKNLRKDNKYRRRLDFNTIKRIVESC